MNVRTPATRRGLKDRHPGTRRRRLGATCAAVALLAALAALTACPAGAAPRYPRSFTRNDDVTRGAETPGKDALHRLQIVANLRAEKPQQPVVLLIGGSSARESTVGDDSWAAQVYEYGGPRVAAYNLGCRHDTFTEDLEIVKLLPEGTPGVVYIGVNLGRFANREKPTTVTLPEAEDPPPEYFPHIYSVHKKVQPWATKAYYVRYWLKVRAPQFEARFGYNLDVLEQIVATCLDRGLHPVLLDLPRDLPVIGHAFDGQVAQVKAACSMLAAAYGIPWSTPVRSCRLQDGDFFDLWHLVEPGRVKYQARLSTKTVSLLHKYGMDRVPEPIPQPTAAPAPD
jgi:hypothetical protein